MVKSFPGKLFVIRILSKTLGYSNLKNKSDFNYNTMNFVNIDKRKLFFSILQGTIKIDIKYEH